MLGGHAFAIVAYDKRGFWIQNSWGTRWGAGGFGLLSYDDWLANGTDVWVARLGAPVTLTSDSGAAAVRSAGAVEAYAYLDLRRHIISIGNDGALRASGTYGTTPEDVRTTLRTHIPQVMKGWKKKRLLLYAHGGLVSESSAVQRIADYRATFLAHEVYPLAFIWKTDYWTTLKNILQDALSRRRPEGFLDATKDFMLDRLDDFLEPIARKASGQMVWDEMKENALLATTRQDGGARLVASEVARLAAEGVEVHLAGHSAGAILLAPLAQLLCSKQESAEGPLRGQPGLGIPISTCTLWAPACTTRLFKETYLPAVKSKGIDRFVLFTLTDKAEQDDHCAGIYHKSLLYLISNALEERGHILFFRQGTPLLGMEKCIRADPDLLKFFAPDTGRWVLAPNTAPPSSPSESTARHHGDFDDDKPTLRATLTRILGHEVNDTEFSFHRSPSALRDRRNLLG